MSADGYRNHDEASVYLAENVSMAIPIANSGVIMADLWSRHALINHVRLLGSAIDGSGNGGF
jgi:hypothetical protein